MTTQHAYYCCMVGNKIQNKFISNAGLGIVGEFHPVEYRIDWKPNEIVDQERAQKLCEVIRDGINKSKDLECKSVELLKIFNE
mgnify:CR=1 FL=1